MKNPQYYFITDLSCDAISEIVSQKNSDITGKSRGRQIEIHCVSNNHGNSWNPIFFGILYEYENRTIVSGKFQIKSFTKAIMLFIRAFTIMVIAVLCISFITGSFNNGNVEITGVLFFSTVSLIMFWFSFLMDKIGRNLAKDSEKEIIHFIEKELEAKPYLPNFKQDN